MTPIFAALAILAAAAPPPPPQTTPPPVTPPPAATPAPDPAIAAVNAKVDAMMAPFKGKPMVEVVRRLGPSDSRRVASDGQVLFWRNRTEGGTACGMSASGAFVCNRVWGKECMLAVASDLKTNVTFWKLTGEVAACELFLAPPPAQPPVL